jgi:hypothetical protein
MWLQLLTPHPSWLWVLPPHQGPKVMCHVGCWEGPCDMTEGHVTWWGGPDTSGLGLASWQNDHFLHSPLGSMSSSFQWDMR